MDSRMKFCLLTLTGRGKPGKQGAGFVFFVYPIDALRDEQRCFILSSFDIALLNPNTLTCATLRLRRDAAITKKAIYQCVPVFLNESKPQQNAYQSQVWHLLNTTDDSEDFVCNGAQHLHGLSPRYIAATRNELAGW